MATEFVLRHFPEPPSDDPSVRTSATSLDEAKSKADSLWDASEGDAWQIITATDEQGSLIRALRDPRWDTYGGGLTDG